MQLNTPIWGRVIDDDQLRRAFNNTTGLTYNNHPFGYANLDISSYSFTYISMCNNRTSMRFALLWS
jgi:hypothetical protein